MCNQHLLILPIAAALCMHLPDLSAVGHVYDIALQPAWIHTSGAATLQTNGGDFKRCSRCRLTKPTADFPSDTNGNDSCRTCCKACTQERCCFTKRSNRCLLFILEAGFNHLHE